MAKTKTAASSSTQGNSNSKPAKVTKLVPHMSPAQRVAAVNKNIGKSQPLHDFLASIGWR